MMSDARGGSSAGLVRNISLQRQQYGVQPSPRIAHEGVPRVSSFSPMVANQAPAPMYCPSHDEDADGMVPDLQPHDDLQQHQMVARLRRPRSLGYERDMERESIADSNDSPVSRARERSIFVDNGCDSGSDFSKPDYIYSMQQLHCINGPPSDIHVSPFSICEDSWLIAQIRHALLLGIAPMHIFIPPASRMCAMGSPDLEAKFLFLSATSVMIAVVAVVFSFSLSSAQPLLLPTVAIALTPAVGRYSGSLTMATVTCAIGVISYAVTTARLASVVMLVWTSLVPVLSFAALGTRAGVASSFATAAAVFAADFSGPLPEARVSLAGTIAAWVLFLGWTGVVQTQIRKMKCGSGRAVWGQTWAGGGYYSDESASRGGRSSMERKRGEHTSGDVDALVPDAADRVFPTSTMY